MIRSACVCEQKQHRDVRGLCADVVQISSSELLLLLPLSPWVCSRSETTSIFLRRSGENRTNRCGFSISSTFLFFDDFPEFSFGSLDHFSFDHGWNGRGGGRLVAVRFFTSLEEKSEIAVDRSIDADD